MRIVGRDAVEHGRRHQRAVGCAAGDDLGALADGVVDQGLACATAASVPISEPSGALPLRGSPAAAIAALAASLSTKASAIFSSTTMRSVDMQIWPWFMKAPNAAAFTACVDVGVVEHDHRRLAAELEQHRLEVFRRRLCAMIRPTRVEPVKLTRRTAGCAISASTSVGGILRRVGDDVDDARRQAGLAQASRDQPVGAPGRSRRP